MKVETQRTLQVCIQILMQVDAVTPCKRALKFWYKCTQRTLQIELEAVCFDLLRQLGGYCIKKTRLLEGIREKEGEKVYWLKQTASKAQPKF